MRTLITGGAGFIGSHVVERLVREGHEVNVLDDLSAGKAENLAAVASRVSMFHGDVADPATVRTALEGCSTVVHLAAVASVEASVREPLRTNRANLVGSITVMEAAAAMGVQRFVYASSAAVYGEATALPIGEDAPKRPMSPYATDKLAGEHYLANYHRLGRLEGTAFRFFNVYGPRQDPASPYSGVISVFLARVSRGEPVTIHGDGSQTRDFVFVADVVEAIWRSLGSAQADSSGTDLPLMNLGRGTTTDLMELLDQVASVCGRKGQVEVTHGPRRPGDIAHSRADVSRLRARFGWVPATTLAEGLTATLSATNRK